ncbi:MAG: hypothetical protein ACK5Q5_04305 [Planctomycetaceae bacterium]
MSLPKLLGAGLLVCSVLPTGSVEACHPLRPFARRPFGMFNNCCAPIDPCCAPMHAPMMSPAMPMMPSDPCGCGGTMSPIMQPMYQTQLQAVPQTTMVPRQVMTYQTVPQVQMQRQAYVEQVPVTTYQNVTRYRDVAVQVNTQVAQMQTQMVPQTTMSYVPLTTQVGTQMAGWQYGAAPVYGMTPQFPTTTIGTGIVPVPESATLPQSGTIVQPVPYMQGASATDEWSTIRQQGAAAQAPSAATVWQSQLQGGSVAR